jgi:tetratricopeptide (TPR) repeat protein
LRFTQGRPFFDESVPAEVPPSMGDAVRALIEDLDASSRDLVEVMAIWQQPLPDWLGDRLFPEGFIWPDSLIVSDEAGSLRFASDTIGPCVLDELPDDRRRSWHAAILDALEGRDLEPGARAPHLLGAGRTAEAVRELLVAARRAAAARALRQALEHYRLALANLSALASHEVDRPALALDAARVAIHVGDLAWAREALAAIDFSGEIDGTTDPRRRFDILLARGQVLREQRLAAEAAEAYAEARELAQREESLRGEVMRVDLEEAANDFFARNGQAGEDRLRPVIAKLEASGSQGRLAVALNRMAALRNQLGDPGEAAQLSLRAAELARGLGDHLLAARAFINLGAFNLKLGDHSRALWALDRAREQLAICRHDGLAATELGNRGDLLMSLGRFEEAEKTLLHARAIRLRAGMTGRLPATLIQLGRARRHGGLLEDAEACYEEAIALAEEFELPEVHTARANLGELLFHQGELREAERLIRLGLHDPEGSHRAIGLRNLGSLLRRRSRLREALAALDESEATLARYLPHKRALAVIESARVHLDGGDDMAAGLRLAEIEVAAETLVSEARVEFHLARGLLLCFRGEEPYAAFDAALEAARAFGDPTLLAETLIDSISAVLRLGIPDRAWLGRHLAELEDVASRTDARPIAAEVRALRGEAAVTDPQRSAGAELADHFAKNVLEQGKGSVDTLLAQLVGQLDGADGALVLAVRLASDGNLSLAPLPATAERGEAVVRPYRIAARAFDRQVFRRALAATGGNVPQAARLLRLPESTFRYRAGKLGLLERSGRS